MLTQFRFHKLASLLVSVILLLSMIPLSVQAISTIPDWTYKEPIGTSGMSFDSGDVNGDGYSDVIVGFRESDGEYGRVKVFHGSNTGIGSTPTVITGSEFGFGQDIASCDVNGDGYDDVIVGTIGSYDGLNYNGRVYLLLGSPDGLSSTPSWSYTGTQNSELLGDSVFCAKDYNGDGYEEMAIASPYFDNGTKTNAGKIYFFYGTLGNPNSIPDWTYVGDYTDEYIGSQTNAVFDDFNFDGYADIVIGRPQWYLFSQYTPQGKIYINYGNATGFASGATQNIIGTISGHMLGSSLLSGDFNGDNYTDLLATSNYRIYGYWGSSSGVNPTANQDIDRYYDQSQAQMYHFINVPGDVNSDSFDDAIFTGAGGGTVHALKFSGSTSGLQTLPNWDVSIGYNKSLTPNQHGGDFNGDGIADVLIGSPDLFDSLYKGALWAYYGAPDPIQGLSLTHTSPIHPSESANFVLNVESGTQVEYECTYSVAAKTWTSTGQEANITFNIPLEITCTATNSVNTAAYTETVTLH